MGQPIPLIGGAYTARSVIANAQRCVNLFPERNPEGADSPFTYYPTPGLVLKGTPPVAGAARGIYSSSNNKLFYVVGSNVYVVTSNFVFTLLGTLFTTVGMVAMKDNGITLSISDGSSRRYLVDLGTLVFTTEASNPAYSDSNAVAYLDTFLIYNVPGTREWFSSLSNTTDLDPTYWATKTANPDLLVSLGVVNRQLVLLGQSTSEVWTNSGAAGFPFEITQGVFIEFGCTAVNSVARNNLKLYWLAQNENGWCQVAMMQGYKVNIISNKAIENEINSYAVKSDAVGFIYQQAGHTFYFLTFPTANKTWVVSLEEDSFEWHERVWIDSSGIENRHRANCHSFAFGQNLVGDWENGNLYCFDTGTYTDNGQPIIRRRGFPHLNKGGNMLEYASFAANMNAGTVISGSNMISLRYSDTRGKSWGTPQQQTVGNTGQYNVQPSWSQLGTARDKVFELFWSINGEVVLQGCYLQFGGESDT
jgi:hypothetical protein